LGRESLASAGIPAAVYHRHVHGAGDAFHVFDDIGLQPGLEQSSLI
jgi:hypothetical protein